ncbi:MAG: AbiH family protein [Mollicutes bacterium]|nr:AbiH family protein [Mollicutes bacterium]
MTTKDADLQKLKKVKVILGNGFDLYCGLHTSYRDYFSSQKEMYESISGRINYAANYLEGRAKDGNQFSVFDVSLVFTPRNVWDVFFALSFENDSNQMWCDVEKAMFDSLVNSDSIENSLKPHWGNVYKFLDRAPYREESIGSFVLAYYIRRKRPELFSSEADFYEFLLSELKEFEERFARFITRQHIAYDAFLYHFNADYVARTRRLLETLCKPEEIVSIDCFNYGFTPEPVFYNKCNFVNGDISNPIFGVDSKFEPVDPRYIFTKTNRRIEWEMNRSIFSQYSDFENAVVFGHSLNEHDYSYFFPVLDQLEMTNFALKKKLVISYCIYDEGRETEIKRDIRHRIYSLFVAYAKYKGQSIEPARLLDSLTTQGRVMTVSVPPCQGYQPFDKDGIDFWAPKVGGKSTKEKWDAYISWAKGGSPAQCNDGLRKKP